MSQENIRLVELAYQLMNAGELDRFLELLSPDVVWEEFYLPPGTRYEGHAGALEWIAATAEAVVGGHFIPQRYFEHEDAVVIDTIVRITGASSGATAESRIAHLIRIGDDGLATYVAAFPDLETALGAGGIDADEALAR